MKKGLSYKYSKQREALFTLLCSTKTHPTAAWLYNQLRKDFPRISQGTVYRNLNILAEQKRIKVITVDGSFAHFDADMSVHNHVICTKCGRVDDAFMPSVYAVSAFPAPTQPLNAASDFRKHTSE